jgi:hypothetical protein
MHTTYVSQLLRIPPGTLKEMLTIITPSPGRPTGMFLTGYEHDTWMFTVFGMVGHEPPRDLAGMLAFAQSYAPAHLLAAVRAGEPIAPVVQHRMPSSQWRRYDKMQRFPGGLLVCGDAICSFNPIYGQGISVAALDAVALRDCLRRGVTDLPRRYFRAAAKAIGVAWQIGAGSDLAFPEVEGRRTPATRATNRLVDWVLTACESDAVVGGQFFKVTALVDPPARLLRPSFLLPSCDGQPASPATRFAAPASWRGRPSRRPYAVTRHVVGVIAKNPSGELTSRAVPIVQGGPFKCRCLGVLPCQDVDHDCGSCARQSGD